VRLVYCQLVIYFIQPLCVWQQAIKQNPLDHPDKHCANMGVAAESQWCLWQVGCKENCVLMCGGACAHRYWPQVTEGVQGVDHGAVICRLCARNGKLNNFAGEGYK